MVNPRSSDAAELATPVAPVVKRKRRASCLGEQERRERKRAIDREAQRSLREKTKTHIADLERTIQILRDQDRNGATASLLSEIDGLRAENERLRDMIDNIRNVLGNDVASRASTTEHPTTNGGCAAASPASSSNEHRSPKPQTVSFANDSNHSMPTPTEPPTSYDLGEQRLSTGLVDIDGMNIVTDVNASSALDMDLELEPVEEIPNEPSKELRRTEVDVRDWENNYATASWGPLMQEFFGDSWECPSLTILHIDAPGSSTSPFSTNVCPIWKKTNELYGKIYTSCSSTGTQSLTPRKEKLSAQAEVGLLYLAIKQGWSNISDEWMQSPALVILKQVDEYLFCHLPKMERLANAYKSFKLLKYYLDGSTEQLSKVPLWLRPSTPQSSTAHPITIDFFPWPTLRNRLVSKHTSIFQNSALSQTYRHYLNFNWPLTFEDAFFHDEEIGMWRPVPLFEYYHNDLKNWSMREGFYDEFPEMRGDIEGDGREFGVRCGV